jgi:hypothetical protein
MGYCVRIHSLNLGDLPTKIVGTSAPVESDFQRTAQALRYLLYLCLSTPLRFLDLGPLSIGLAWNISIAPSQATKPFRRIGMITRGGYSRVFMRSIKDVGAHANFARLNLDWLALPHCLCGAMMSLGVVTRELFVSSVSAGLSGRGDFRRPVK